jgi:hypothetical protein
MSVAGKLGIFHSVHSLGSSLHESKFAHRPDNFAITTRLAYIRGFSVNSAQRKTVLEMFSRNHAA